MQRHILARAKRGGNIEGRFDRRFDGDPRPKASTFCLGRERGRQPWEAPYLDGRDKVNRRVGHQLIVTRWVDKGASPVCHRKGRRA